jgi:Tfp pilus assembly protein PilN
MNESGTIAEPRRPAGIHIGGFNLLPYRQRVARGRRHRVLIEAAAAGLAGVLAALAWTASDALQRAGLADRRAGLESMLAGFAAPLAEYRQLERISGAASEHAELAARHARPLARILDVVDALSRVPDGAVALHRLELKDGGLELDASAVDSEASAAWIDRLASVRRVRSAEITDWRLAADGAPYSTNVQARLQWDDADAARASPGRSAVGRGRR